jgi:hypothetical protein
MKLVTGDCVAVIVLTFMCLLGPSLANSAGLYGTLGFGPTLVKIDPTTAKFHHIVNQSVPDGKFVSDYSLDVKRHILYVVVNIMDAKYQLLGLSLDTGNLISSMTLPYPFWKWGAAQTCDVIPETGEVLLTGIIGARDMQQYIGMIYRIDPKTETYSIVNWVESHLLMGFRISVYDPKHELYWTQFVIPSNNPPKDYSIINYAFDINTGKIIYQVNNTLAFQTWAYDPVTEKIYGFGVLGVYPSYQIILGSLDSQNGEMKTIALLPGFREVLPWSQSPIDPVGRKIFGYLKSVYPDIYHLVTVSLTDGSVLTTAGACSLFDCPWTLVYEP